MAQAKVPEDFKATLRALPPIMYARMPEPDAVAAEIQRAWPTVKDFRNQNGNFGLVEGDERVLAVTDPYDCHAMALVRIRAGHEFHADSINWIVQQRARDERWCVTLILVGEDPSTKVIPEWMQHSTFPIDLIEPLHEGRDDRPRENPTTREQVQTKLNSYTLHQSRSGPTRELMTKRRSGHQVTEEDFQSAVDHIPIPRAPDLPEAGEQLIGLSVAEVVHAMGLAILANFKNPEMEVAQRAFDARINDAIRHRWGRIA